MQLICLLTHTRITRQTLLYAPHGTTKERI